MSMEYPHKTRKHNIYNYDVFFKNNSLNEHLKKSWKGFPHD